VDRSVSQLRSGTRDYHRRPDEASEAYDKIPEKYGNPETSGYTQEVPASGIKDLKFDLK
jgi:hypothetical protein